MGEVVNLRQARKRSTREKQAVKAEANRVAFGLSTKLKTKARKETARADAVLEGHRLDRKPAPTDGSD